jgi:hypothetical protein
MATLTGQSIADSYEQLLSLPNGGLNGTTLVAITDGDSSTACCLQLSTTKALIEGDGSTLYFFDEGGEYIKADNAGKLTIAGAAEVEVNTAIFDVNASGSISIDSSAGSIDMNVVDGQTVAIGLNGGVETLWKPHGTAGSELWSTINTSGTTDGTDAAGSILLSAVAGGIGLAWADGKDLWAEGGRFVVTANENAADAIKLHADAGSSQTITIVNDAGTGAAAIGLTASAGGITVGLGGGAGDDFIVDTTTLVVESDNNRVGIGTAAPATTLDVVSGVSAASPSTSSDSTTTSGTILRLDGSDGGVCDFGIQSGGGGIWIQSTDQTNHSLSYPIRLNENGGKVGIGVAAPAAILHVYAEDTEPLVIFESDDDDVDSGDIILQLDFSDDTNIHGVTARFISFHDEGGEIGYITTAADGSVNAITTSDVRLKKDIVDTSINGISIINALKIRDFTWNDKAGKALEGLEVKAQYIADEVYEVYPLATTGTPGAMKDILDDDGNKTGEEIDRMGVGDARLISVLIKSVQELSASNDALKARIEVLEA